MDCNGLQHNTHIIIIIIIITIIPHHHVNINIIRSLTQRLVAVVEDATSLVSGSCGDERTCLG